MRPRAVCAGTCRRRAANPALSAGAGGPRPASGGLLRRRVPARRCGAPLPSSPAPPRARPPPAHRPAAAAAADADAAAPSGDDLNARFSEELSRRRIASIDDIKDAPAPPPGFARDAELSSGQLERSRRLNAEGLEGLIPRGTELLKLGLSFFLAFGPFILGVALATALVWGVFGEAFIHVSPAAPSVRLSRQNTSWKHPGNRPTNP